MNKKVILSALSFTIFFSGCSIHRFVGVKKENKKIVKREIKQNSINVHKTKPKIAKQYTIKDEEKSDKKVKKKKIYTKRNLSKKVAIKRKSHKLKPEPFSIKSNEQDPELLGPQTTLKNNPISKVESATTNKM